MFAELNLEYLHHHLYYGREADGGEQIGVGGGMMRKREEEKEKEAKPREEGAMKGSLHFSSFGEMGLCVCTREREKATNKKREKREEENRIIFSIFCFHKNRGRQSAFSGVRGRGLNAEPRRNKVVRRKTRRRRRRNVHTCNIKMHITMCRCMHAYVVRALNETKKEL